MEFKYHFQLMAAYNNRLNRQVYEATSMLNEDDYLKDAGAFFGSIQGTLNHIVVADLIWLGRFITHSDSYHSLKATLKFQKPSALNEILYPQLDDLTTVRQQLDQIILAWVSEEIREEDLERDFSYTNTKGLASRRNFAELLSHFFNHQTHHRGQVSTLLYQFGQDVGITDFLIDIPDKPE